MKSKLTVFVAGFIGVVLVSAAVSYLTLHRMEKKSAVNDPTLEEAHTWIHEAELSVDQLKALQPEEAALRKDLDAIQDQIVRERKSITTILNSTATDVSAIDENLNRVAALEAAQQRLVMRHLISMRNLMTPAQRDRFFNAMLHGMCVEYRQMSCEPGKPCVCGMCSMHKKI